MKNIIKSAVAMGLLGLAASLYAGWISPSGTLNKSSVAAGDTVHFQRGGSAQAGVNWTEATLWYPDSRPALNLGHGGYVGNGFTYNEPFPTTEHLSPAANGTHSVQYRLVDNNIDYQDQWLEFTGYGFGGDNPPENP